MPRKSSKCRNCGKMHTSADYVHCVACRKVRRARAKQNTLDALAEGYCTSCRKFEAEPGMTKCASCLEYWKRRWRTRRAEALTSGTCTKCFKEPAGKGFMQCDRCRARIAKWNRARRLRDKAQIRDAIAYILSVLKTNREFSLKELAADAGIATRTILRHAPKLVEQGLMNRRLDGFKAYYSGGRNLWANV
jgi:hypothetical protein